MSSTQRLRGRTLSAAVLAVLVGVPATLSAADSGSADAASVAVARLHDAYRSGDATAMLDTYTDDVLFEDVNQRHRFAGDEFAAFLGTLAQVHTAMDIVVDRQLVDGDTVVVEYRYTGTLSGAALSQALGKEGCPDLEYSMPATSWYRVRDGRIAHQKDFIDLATMRELQAQAAAAADAGEAGESGEGR